MEIHKSMFNKDRFSEERHCTNLEQIDISSRSKLFAYWTTDVVSGLRVKPFRIQSILRSAASGYKIFNLKHIEQIYLGFNRWLLPKHSVIECSFKNVWLFYKSTLQCTTLSSRYNLFFCLSFTYIIVHFFLKF